MLQQRLPVQQLFNNNRPMSTNNYRAGSTTNYQQMTRNHRPQIAKKHQLQPSTHIGEKIFMSTGRKYQNVNIDPLLWTRFHVPSQLGGHPFNMCPPKYHWQPYICCHQEMKRHQHCWLTGNSTRDFKNRVLHSHFNLSFINQSLSFIVIWAPTKYVLIILIPTTASSYGEKDHFTKTIFVSTSTTKVTYLSYSLYSYLSSFVFVSVFVFVFVIWRERPLHKDHLCLDLHHQSKSQLPIKSELLTRKMKPKLETKWKNVSAANCLVSWGPRLWGGRSWRW